MVKSPKISSHPEISLLEGIEIPKEIFFTNTMTRKKELFTPFKKGEATLYSCGPTVYNYIHIGNLRGAVVSDLIFRVLTKLNYKVTYARNYTDIDDKIIQQAEKENCTWNEVSEKYILEVNKDYQAAGCLPPTITPKATEYIEAMMESIQTMVQNGHAYVVKDGSVFFNVSSFSDYGKLSKRDPETMEALARVESTAEKKSPMDFALWKASKPGEPSWKSPWGEGRPGWHIECTSMVHKTMGLQIDLHHGGEDLIFPHHENEIAQAECCGSPSPFVGVWIHHAFLTLSNQKMSKSLGNVFTARDFINQFSGEVSRYLLLSVHYRSVLDFSDESIDKSLSELERIYESKAQAEKIIAFNVSDKKLNTSTSWSDLRKLLKSTREEIWRQYTNDLNTPAVLGAFFTLIRQFNRVFTEEFGAGQIQDGGAESMAFAQEFLALTALDIGEVLGVGKSPPAQFLEDLNRMRANKEKIQGKKVLDGTEIEKKLSERLAARQAKDFKKSDEIRNFLLENGVEIKDSPAGTTWNYK